MLLIQTSKIEKKDNLSVYNLNYPIIKSDDEKNIINHINNRIYEDIIAFKSVVEDIVDINNNHLSFISTNYYIKYNNNGIISIPIEFTQVDGLYNISYINSYNYDINLEKEINIKDLFKSEVDYMKIINKKIDSKIKELSRNISLDKYIMVLDYLKDIIYSDDPTFYISKDGIVICFSSYELDSSIEDISTFQISFIEDINYLSKYIRERVIDS